VEFGANMPILVLAVLNYAVANTRQISCSYFWGFLLQSFPENPILATPGGTLAIIL